MRQTAIDFLSSKRVSLQGIVTTPEVPPRTYAALVMCHPHPMLGGSMEHPLVTAVCRKAHSEGIASLRFNFRGVGPSEGAFTNGPEEQNDVRAALEILKLMPDIDAGRIGLVGYSFGASAILGGLRGYGAARSFVLIAPPVSSVRKSRILKDKRPKLFIVGERDRVVPSVELQRVLDEARGDLRFQEVADANHALESQTEEVAELVSEFLLETLSRPPSRFTWRPGRATFLA